MRISSIKAAGFRGIKGEITLSIPAGFAVITGANGAGKSTVCDAIEYAICGTLSRINPAKESGESIAEYVWWRGRDRPKNRFVQIEIEKEDGTRFLIERGPEGFRGTTEQEILDCFCDKTSRPSDSLNYLVRTAVLRGEQIADLSLDLPEADRFNFVKACLGARDHSDIEGVASVLAKTLKSKVERLELDYEKGRFRITDITSRISAVKAQAFKAEEILEAETSIRRMVNRPVGDFSDLIRIARSTVVILKNKLDALVNTSRQLSGIEQRLSEISTPEFKLKLNNLETLLRGVMAERDRRQADTQALEERIMTSAVNVADIIEWAGLHQHGSALGLQEGRCPLCALEIPAEQFETNLESIKARIESQSKASADLIRERTKASDDLRKLIAQFDALQRQHKDLSTLTEVLTNERGALLQSLRSVGLPGVHEEAQLFAAASAHANSIRGELAVLEKQLSILESSKALERVAELEKELTKCQTDSESLAKLISKAKSAEERFKEAAANVKRVSGELVDERLAELSPLLTELYSRLKPHVDWPSVSYITRGDVRRFLSLRIGEDLNPRFMFSNGQRRAAGLAFLLAVHLSRSWCRLNSLILDDPVQHIDDFRALHLVEVLSAIRQTGRQVICTIEDSELAKLLCRRLRSLATQEGTMISLDYQPEQGVNVREERPIFALPKTTILAA